MDWYSTSTAKFTVHSKKGKSSPLPHTEGQFHQGDSSHSKADNNSYLCGAPNFDDKEILSLNSEKKHFEVAMIDKFWLDLKMMLQI